VRLRGDVYANTGHEGIRVEVDGERSSTTEGMGAQAKMKGRVFDHAPLRNTEHTTGQQVGMDDYDTASYYGWSLPLLLLHFQPRELAV
jgi:hypothetical protein